MFARLMGLRSISPSDLHQAMLQQPTVIVDVNSRQSWINARVPGALNLDPFGYGPADLPADSKSRIVFYCSNPLCRKAPNAALRAKKMGYSDVRVMSAGITGWTAMNLPTESGE
jgi:rhodanese-related sulfurtransferase